MLHDADFVARVFIQKFIVNILDKKFPAFMEHGGSFPCPQKPAIGPYYEPMFL
jgi:hypothetical protein